MASPFGVSVQGWVVTPEAPQGQALRSEDALGEGPILAAGPAGGAGLPVCAASLAHRAGAAVSGARPSPGCRRTEPPHSGRPGSFPAGESQGRGERPCLWPARSRYRARRALRSAGCGVAVSQTRGGERQNKGNTQEPDKRGDRFLIDTTSPPPEAATILTYRIAPHAR